MTDVFLAAQRFLLAEGRLLERRLFGTLFDDQPADGVLDALRGYQNADGGFGHGLEPDKRLPGQSPGGRRGRLPGDGDLDFDHPWRAAATGFCWQAIETGALPDEVHALAEVLAFLAHVPDRARAERHAPAVLERLAASPMYQAVPEPGEYGLTPLTVAATADAPWRNAFAESELAAHLDQLAAAQQPDGGWPVAWQPPSEASRLDWRGIVTLQALRTLTSYGRLTPVRAGT